jgi:hypothetical protein
MVSNMAGGRERPTVKASSTEKKIKKDKKKTK